MDKIKVFGLYLGCEIEITSAKGTIGTLAAINANHNTITVNQDENSGWVATVDECQLILTPLEQISDEDAIEVVKIAAQAGGIDLEGIGVSVRERNQEWIHLNVGHMTLALSFENGDVFPYCTDSPSIMFPPNNVAHAIDYLRSRYYNLPYMGMDLVENGIAVLKTK